MPLSWNEIKDRALAFSKEWADAKDEKSEAQRFWFDFFNIFGFSKQRVLSYEHAIIKQGAGYKGNRGWIDLLWPGVLLIEHKSRGKDLDIAYNQAIDYFSGLKERDLPHYVIVCDFARFRIYDLDKQEIVEFRLGDLHKHIKRFSFIAGYQAQVIRPQDPVNVKAAEQMGRLHDKRKAAGYEGHPLEVLLVRLLSACLPMTREFSSRRKASANGWSSARRKMAAISGHNWRSFSRFSIRRNRSDGKLWMNSCAAFPM